MAMNFFIYGESETLTKPWININKPRKPMDTITVLKPTRSETNEFEKNAIKMSKMARDYHDKIQLQDCSDYIAGRREEQRRS